MEQLQAQLSTVLDEPIESVNYFTQGQIGNIYKVKTPQNHYILKTSQPSNRLQIEHGMLLDIKNYHITVPSVFDVSPTHLLMEYIQTEPVTPQMKEKQASELLSRLHCVTNESRMYGYYYDTTIASFMQKNEQTQYNWGLFLVQMRIIPMAKICYERGYISKEVLGRLEHLSKDIYTRIDISKIRPSLLHGDLWSGNILFNMKGATLIDPAIYFGDREMELAFILMFNTFGETFFRIYEETYTLSEDFYDVKVPLYQLYPVLVHVAIYGGAYTGELDNLLRRLKI